MTLERVSRRYGDTVALDGLGLTVPAGEIVGFVGANGAGKTTAMRIALGILAADEGRVLWNGAPASRDLQRTFGYMPEERGLYPKMRVADHLRYLAALHGVDDAAARAATDRWIDTLGLADRAGDSIEALSLGNQQRVQLAAALVHDPDVLILDEPFSGLDPIGTDVMSAVLRERADAGAAVVFSSHQLDLVERLCDRVAIVDAGRLVAAGTTEELRAARAGIRLRVEVDGRAPGDWAGRLPGVAVVGGDDGAVIVELADGVDDQAVLDAARAAGPVRSFAPVRPSLAELFREVVGR
ncbi:MAG: ABC transporter ATP-binding protein [Solirubrobacterales bacterium]|nr:ABC transporter ATP-binding protein [Solirubrobacterales bacterium]